MRNPLCLYRAKYYRTERADAAFVSPPFTDCETADKWLTRKLSEGATGGTIEIAYVDVPANAWELPASFVYAGETDNGLSRYVGPDTF